MKDEYSQIIVKRILELCRQRDFTIYQLSAMSGISYSTLDNLINHKTFNPFSLTLSEFFDYPELEEFSFEDTHSD